MSAPYRNLEEDEFSVDSAGSQSSAGKFSSAEDGSSPPDVEVVGMRDFSSIGGAGSKSIRGKVRWKACLALAVVSFLLLLVIILIVKLSSKGDSGDAFPWDDIRLPGNLVPSEYKIFLHPDLDKKVVDGRVTIQMTAVKTTDSILIHAATMNFTKTVLRKKGSSGSIEINQPPKFSKNLSMAYLDLSRTLEKGGVYELVIEFSYNLTDRLRGFYVSSYMEENATKVIGSTQMEPLSARKAFPCFDEPGMRAKFSLELVHEPRYNVTLFNMPKKKETEPYPEDTSLQLETFESSLSMSTYLVAFVICDFAKVDTVTSNGTKVAVYSRGVQQNQMGLALDVLNRTIPFYESYFNVPYPLPKQDMAAIPNFEAGAMENWGLVLYRETALLYQEGVSKTSQKQRIVVVITHELAHQWFGNLVTMKWWNDLWLNEGFASYVEYVGCANLYPEWGMMDQFYLETSTRGLVIDSLSDSHPISVEVRDEDEINGRFDRISYDKGASIIRMLSNYLHEDVFKTGLHKYLNDHAFSNTVTSDLWDALSAVSNINVTELMDYWTLQMGYPLVKMSRQGSKVTVTQQQFLISPQGKPSSVYKSKFDYKWRIPLVFSYYDGTVKYSSNIIDANKDSTSLPIPESTSWIKGNSRQYGFFRMTYDRANWDKLTDVLLTDHEKLDPVDRAGIFDDAFHVFRADKLEMEVPFGMIDYLEKEREYVPFATALANLGFLKDMLQFHASYGNFTTYLKKVLEPAMTDLTFEDTGEHLEMLLRADLVEFLFDIGDETVLQWMQDNLQANLSTVGVNLYPIVRCGRVMLGQTQEWEEVWEEYKVNTIASENLVLLKTLSCTRDPALLTRYLYESLSNDFVRSQDATYVISYVLNNPAGTHLALNFLFENWDKLADMLGGGVFTMTSLIKGMTSWVSTPVLAIQVERFFDEKYLDATAGQKVPVLQAFETMGANVLFMEKNGEKIAKWFAHKSIVA